MQMKTFVPPSVFAQIPAADRGHYAPTRALPTHKSRLLGTTAQTHPADRRR